MWTRCSVLRVGSRAMKRGGAACALLVLASSAMLGESLGELLGASGPAPWPCPPCPPHPTNCTFSSVDQHDCFYKINNNKDLRIQIDVKKTFSLICDDGMTLNDSSLPRFLEHTYFLTVILDNCPLPTEPYAHVFELINVSIKDTLILNNVPPGKLRADHFRKLETLSKLTVKASSHKLTVAADNVTIFNQLSNLMELKLENVNLLHGVNSTLGLENLKELHLTNCALKKIQFNQLCDLPVLHTLFIFDNTLWSNASGVICNFTSVSIYTRKFIYPPSFPFATHLTLRGKIVPEFKNCSSLQYLTVYNYNPTLTSLPNGWLEPCTQLVKLTLKMPFLQGLLTERALPAANSLETLTITDTQLTNLSHNLFDNNTKLRVLVLSNNKLKYLPPEVFTLLSDTLEELDLSNNLLDSNAVTSLDTLKNLQKLSLPRNELGDLCGSGPDGTYHYYTNSKISKLNKLTELSLMDTRATRICHDWHSFTYLRTLHLEDNNITTLEWRDLQDWRRSTEKSIEVRLTNSKLNFISMTRKQYEQANDGSTSPQVKVNFITGDTFLRCDCRMYWFAKALAKNWFPVRFETLYCEGKGKMLLENTPLEEMVCEEYEMCPANCTCLWRLSNESAEIDCSSRGLTVFPDLKTLNWSWIPKDGKIVLRVQNNNISALPAELPPRLALLDARDNALSGADDRTVRALFAAGRRVLLAGNPLDCRCSQPLMLNLTLAAFTNQITDFTSTLCADGRLLLEAFRASCTLEVVAGEAGAAVAMLPWWGALAAAGGALLLAGGAAWALWRSARLRLKAFLLARGLCLRWSRPNDDNHCKYDAFLSYAHEDEAVALELLRALEGGAGGAGGAPLRLCVHHRDWQPGEWILGQIAKSVRESHRTIILLSENFAKSSWARAEFREAYAHALREDAARLIVVVLGAAPPADLDDDIRHYVRHNTYVRWGEPAFWEKLRVALPPGRPHLKRSPQRPRTRSKQKQPKETTAKQPAPAQPAPTQPKAEQSTPATPQPAAPPRPPPLRSEPPDHQAPPRPPTPVVKFGQIDFSAPLKPAATSAPPCA